MPLALQQHYRPAASGQKRPLEGEAQFAKKQTLNALVLSARVVRRPGG